MSTIHEKTSILVEDPDFDEGDRTMEYEEKDIDMMSTAFQTMRLVFGKLIIIGTLPVGCLCGPLVVVPEGSRAAVLKFGKFRDIVPPGTYVYTPLVETYRIVSVQTQAMVLPNQNVITKDGISVTVDAVTFYRIQNIRKAIFGVQDYEMAVSNLAQYTLKLVLGEHNLEEILQKCDELASRVAHVVEAHSRNWGITFQSVEIKDVRIFESLVRVMAASAEARREGDAKVISARAEVAAAEAFAEAAKCLAATEGAMQLRYMQTLTEIAAEKNSTVIIPSDVAGLFGKK